MEQAYRNEIIRLLRRVIGKMKVEATEKQVEAALLEVEAVDLLMVVAELEERIIHLQGLDALTRLELVSKEMESRDEDV